MRKFVLGIGNLLLKDEGVGCHVAHALEKACQLDVEVIDGGTSLEVVSLLEGADKVVIVDAVKGGGTPGQIYRFCLEDVTWRQKMLFSLHDVNLVEALMVMKCRHDMGDIVIIGVEPKEISWGLELSPELQEKMPQIIEIVLAELNKGDGKC